MTNYNIERYKKLEYLLIPETRIEMIEAKGTPRYEGLRRKLEELQVERDERICKIVRATGRGMGGIL